MPKIRYHPDDLYDNSDDFPEVVKYLMQKHQCVRRDIVIDSRHPCGEDVIFVRGKWEGYVDERFYEEMEENT